MLPTTAVPARATRCECRRANDPSECGRRQPAFQPQACGDSIGPPRPVCRPESVQGMANSHVGRVSPGRLPPPTALSPCQSAAAMPCCCKIRLPAGRARCAVRCSPAAIMRQTGISSAAPATAIGAQRSLERGQRHLVDAQGAGHGVAAQLLDDRLFAKDNAGLRPAQQLVAAEGDRDRRRTARFPARSVRRQDRRVSCRAACRCPGRRSAARRARGPAPPVRPSAGMVTKPSWRKLLLWTRMMAAVSAVMACTKSRRWVRLVVPTSTSRAPLWRRTSGMRKPPPISTSWPRLIRHLAPLAEGRQHQVDGGSVVVDHQGVLGAGQIAQEAAGVVMTAAPRAWCQFIFQVAVA